MPSSVAARKTRMAISDRLATRTLRMGTVLTAPDTKGPPKPTERLSLAGVCACENKIVQVRTDVSRWVARRGIGEARCGPSAHGEHHAGSPRIPRRGPHARTEEGPDEGDHRRGGENHQGRGGKRYRSDHRGEEDRQGEGRRAFHRALMIVVFGSINVDLVCRVARTPAPGETVRGSDYVLIPGGKGANQALAARRAGAKVRLFGTIGYDAFADIALSELSPAGVDLSGIARRGGTTGVAVITVDDRGENAIVLSPGANAHASASTINASAFSSRDTLLLQME